MAVLKAAVCFLLATNLIHGEIFTAEQVMKIEDFVSNVMECWNVPGLTIGIVKGNQTWTQGFGFADLEKQKPVTSSTLFGIGSLTKGFTSTLLSILLDESSTRYNWTSKLSAILGEDFKLVDEYRTKETTLRDILTHRTGLPSGDIGMFGGYPKTYTRKDATRRLQYLEQATPFRDTFVYSNIMYVLVAHVIETLSEHSWEEELKSRILDRLKMSDTRVIGKSIEVTADNMAKPYVTVGDQLVLTSPEIYHINPDEPAGAIASSADDMVKWIQLHLNKGNMTDGQVLADWKTLQAVFHPYSTVSFDTDTKPTFPISDVDSGYGYGWFLGNHAGYRKIWHSGGLFSYTSMIWIFPDLDIGFFGSRNGPGIQTIGRRVFQTIMSYLFDIVMNNKPWLNKTTSCSFPSPWQPEPKSKNNTDDVTNQPVKEPTKYVGVYGHKLLGNIHVISEGTSLYFRMGRFNGNLNSTKMETKFKLQTTGDFDFMYHQKNIYHVFPVTFESIKDGKYQNLVIELDETQIYKFERDVKWVESVNIHTSNGSSIHNSFLAYAYMVINQMFVE